MNPFYPAAMIHLDLAEGLPAEPLNTAGRSAYIVFWWRGVPLAHRHLPADSLPIPPGQLCEIALQAISPAVSAYLSGEGLQSPESPALRDGKGNQGLDLQTLIALERPLQSSACHGCDSVANSISVVVCTRNRPEKLKHCLQSLIGCSHTPIEIVVIDNAPSDDSTRQLVDRYPQVRYILEPRPGLDIARNTGIRSTTGQIVAFIDDDVTVSHDWAKHLIDCFSDPSVMAATGLVMPYELETEAQSLFERYWGFHRGYRILTYDTAYFMKFKPWGVPVWEIGAGANMAFRREAFELVGNFDVRLDVGAAGCNGDSELWYRILAAGLICRYDPRMTAFHTHRREMLDLKRQLYAYMRGHTAALLFQFAKHKHWGNVARLLILLPFYYFKLIAQGVRHGFQSRHQLIPTEWAGCVAGVWFFLWNLRVPSSAPE